MIEKNLYEQVQKLIAEAKHANNSNKEFSDTSFTPITERLRRIIAALPPDEKVKPQTLEFFRSRLRGRQRRNAQAGEVGQALRSLNYVRKRSWRKEFGGFCSLWYPPEHIENREQINQERQDI